MQQEKTEQFSFALLNNNLNLLHRLLGAINLLRLASSASFFHRTLAPLVAAGFMGILRKS